MGRLLSIVNYTIPISTIIAVPLLLAAVVTTACLLREHDVERDELRERYKYVLVDEYQDTNLVQYRLVNQVSGGRSGFGVTTSGQTNTTTTTTFNPISIKYRWNSSSGTSVR